MPNTIDKKYKILLERYDEAGVYEFPSGFDYAVLEHDARVVEKILLDQLGMQTKFEGMNCNQDASFSIAIVLSEYITRDDLAIYQPSVLFSNFGRLATVTLPELLPEQLVKQIQRELEAREFHYIPAEVLDAHYDGVMSDEGRTVSWWSRYFDWL